VTTSMNQLTPIELEALRAAVSDEFMDDQRWVVMPTGQVKDENGIEVYKRGYVNGVLKLI
ncbi:gamma-mobile-trio protein GmtX, partial [Vibrio anguillarum]